MTEHDLSVREVESWITEEHLQLRGEFDRIERVQDPHELLLLLRDLAKDLDEHFAREEGDDGLIPLVGAHTPEHTARMEELLEEHRHLHHELMALIKECRSLLVGPLARVERQREYFLRRVRQHDAEETEILTDVVLKSRD